jgi:hypothetical protein
MTEINWAVVKRLPTDYTEYGGTIKRWENPDEDYPDCASGCYWWKPLDSDWGVCNNVNSPRAGLLTFEHQTGKGCFEL